MRKNTKVFDEKAIIERVRLVRIQYAGKRGRSKFARELGISASTYSYYESNRVAPIEVLLRICEITGADLKWLLTGSGPGEKISFGPNSEILRKLESLLTDAPKLAEPVMAFLELLSEKRVLEKERKILPSKASRPGWIPVLGRTAAGMVHFWDQTFLPEPKTAITQLDELVKRHIGKATIGSVDKTVLIDLQARALVNGIKGADANLIQVSGQEDEQVVEFVNCEEIYKLFPDSFGLQVDGDSMSPRINDGDIVILSPSVPAAQGQIGIARVANQIGVTCKLIRSTEKEVHLIPKKDLLWALAVLCHIGV
jgi:transcriptional regulator with XRE-family HTH domain